MDRDTALRKIQKCLNLSKSSEPHEAARAMEQAQKLMEQFNVDHPELLAVGVEQHLGVSRAARVPPEYEVQLAHAIGDSFGCNVLFQRGIAAYGIKGGYQFIGVGAAAQVAAYTFAVLARLLLAARTTYTAEKLARYRKNKIAAADEFCAGWVQAVANIVQPALADEARDASLAAYMAKHYPDLGSITPRRRELANSTRGTDHQVNGWLEGKKARVHTGLAGEKGAQLSLGM